MYQLIPAPVPPATTMAGNAKGPCVHLGPTRFAGQPVYVGEQELRGMLKAFGWPTPERYERACEQLDEAVAQSTQLSTELQLAREQIAALEVVVRMGEKQVEAAV